MNRKEGTIVGVILLSTFIGGVFAAPAIQNIVIVNDPLNVRIVGTPSSLQPVSVQILVNVNLTLEGQELRSVGAVSSLGYSKAVVHTFVQSISGGISDVLYIFSKPDGDFPGRANTGVSFTGQVEPGYAVLGLEPATSTGGFGRFTTVDVRGAQVVLLIKNDQCCPTSFITGLSISVYLIP